MPRGEVADGEQPVVETTEVVENGTERNFTRSTVEIRQTNPDGTETFKVMNSTPEGEAEFAKLFELANETLKDPNATAVRVEINDGIKTVTTHGEVTPEARQKLDEVMAGFNERVANARSQGHTSVSNANRSSAVRAPVALGVVFLMNYLFFCLPGIVLYISNRKLIPAYAKKVLILTIFQIVLSALALILYKSGVILSRLRF
jgi:hypothetical protein